MMVLTEECEQRKFEMQAEVEVKDSNMILKAIFEESRCEMLLEFSQKIM